MGVSNVLDQVDESLERFLRSEADLSPRDIDVSFETPSREWAGKLNNRPTVNVFLCDIKRSAERSRTGLETYQHEGVTKRRIALPRVELRYLISTWTSEHADERLLMGRLLRALLAHSEIPVQFVAEPLRELSPLTLALARSGEGGTDSFKALDDQLRPVLDIVMVADVDTALGAATSRPVEEFEFTLRDSTVAGRTSGVRRVAGQVKLPGVFGRPVTSPRGRATIDVDGRFLVRAQVGDELLIGIDPPQTVVVPEHGGVVIG